MLKFAFMIKMPNLEPDKFIATYDNAESYNVVIGMDSKDIAKEKMQEFIDDGYTLFNLCSGFTPEDAAEYEAMGEGIKVRAAVYNEAEGAKIAALDDYSKYGVVIVMRGVEESAEVACEGPGFAAKAIFVKGQEEANEAAQKLVSEGVKFIEICSWFDAERTQSVIDAIGGAVPVGSCGL